MASLQVLDPSDVKHNYANKSVIGHNERTADDDTYFTGLYGKSVFDQLEGDESTNSGNNGQSGQLGSNGSETPTYTYTKVTPIGTENPSEEGWYESVNEEYVPSEDTEVDEEKDYYTRS